MKIRKIGQVVYLVHKTKIVDARVVKGKVSDYIRRKSGKVEPRFKVGRTEYSSKNYHIFDELEDAVEELGKD